MRKAIEAYRWRTQMKMQFKAWPRGRSSKRRGGEMRFGLQCNGGDRSEELNSQDVATTRDVSCILRASEGIETSRAKDTQ